MTRALTPKFTLHLQQLSFTILHSTYGLHLLKFDQVGSFFVVSRAKLPRNTLKITISAI